MALPIEHPDARQYAKDPVLFRKELFQQLRAVYSSPYNDQTEDIIKALEALDAALHQGWTAEQLSRKIKQAADATEQQYRGAVSKLIRGQYWLREFTKTTHIQPAAPAKPYEGPMPKRP